MRGFRNTGLGLAALCTIGWSTYASAAQWNTLTAEPQALAASMSGQINGIIYVAGGFNSDGSNPSAALQAYDPVTDKWTNLAPMPTAIQGGAAGVINSRLYVAGGDAPGYTRVDTLYVYDPVANGWAQLASMPQPCLGIAGVIDSKLYVLCGFDANGEAKELDVYDPGSNTWTAKASSLVSHASFPASAVINGNFYVAGGDSGFAGTTEMYSPGTNAWKKLRNMTTPVTYTSGTELDGRLYAFGGTPAGGGPIATVQAFDPVTNHWKKLSPSSPVTLSTQNVEVVYGEVFVSGGGTSSGIVGTNESVTMLPSIP